MILKLKSVTKDYIWGGTRLRDEYGKTGDSQRLAESWELSCHPDGMSLIDGGEYDGITLREYVEKFPETVGEKCRGEIPVLTLFLDSFHTVLIHLILYFLFPLFFPPLF